MPTLRGRQLLLCATHQYIGGVEQQHGACLGRLLHCRFRLLVNVKLCISKKILRIDAFVTNRPLTARMAAAAFSEVPLMYGNKALFAAAAVTVLFGLNSEAVAKQTRAQLVSMANSACEAALMSGDLAALEKVRKEYKSVVTACSARASTAAAPASRTGSSEGGARSERSFVEAVFGGFGGGAAVNSGSGSGATEVADNSSGGQATDDSTGGPNDGDAGADTGTGGGTESGSDGGGNARGGNRGNGGGNGGGNGTANEGNAAKSDNAPSDGNRGVGGGNGGGNGVASEGQADKSDSNDNGNNNSGNNGKSENAGGNGNGPKKD
ncbi:hypothetical protein ACQKP1_13195 [Allorhizobium sp. NPDC080224]|uniref:hypothetical protein n=1 Tax=Allorhizobium sp. NPDC080224 TaxID=3390547 RepID=UPI003D005E40